MANPITDLLKTPVATLLDSISGIIGRFEASPDAKLKAQLDTQKATFDFQTTMANIDMQEVVAQSGVVTAEIKSDSWLAKNWRPMTMLSFVFIVVYSFVLTPLFGLRHIDFPPQLWTLLTVGITGYTGARTAEKIAGLIKGG